MSEDYELSQFEVLVSYRFQRRVLNTYNREREAIYDCIRDLISSWELWGNRQVKKPQTIPSNRKVRIARISDRARLVFEGPLSSRTSKKPVLFIHDLCNHDNLPSVIRRVLKQELSEEDFIEPESWQVDQEESNPDLNDLGTDHVAFAKPIPPLAFADPQKIDDVLKSEKANIHLTQKQFEALMSLRPLLINGQAGTGKTTILCHRLALSLIQQRKQRTHDSLLYLSYNRRLVDQAKSDVQEILRDFYLEEDDSVDGIEFVPFQEFIKRYVPDPRRFEESAYVSFGRFKRYYEPYRRGNPTARKIPPEVAWHIIRSIMKGACLPQLDDRGKLLPESRPPLSKERYEELSRKRREINEDLYDGMYEIGSWYQQKIIQEKRWWDDQDLAWEALSWIMGEQRKNPNMRLYSEIFCDEVQDLTELEFAILVALCHPPVQYAQEGPFIVLAGDPLQTINPTGFRWEVVGGHIYTVGNRPARRYELEENWRSDKRIVDLANHIQRIRAIYLQQDLQPQKAFLKESEGDFPHVVYIETEDEVKAVQGKLKSLPSRSAVILWPEQEEEVLEVIQEDQALRQLAIAKLQEYVNRPDEKEKKTAQALLHSLQNGTQLALAPADEENKKEVLDKLMADLDLYQVSDAKGLEFRLVILYKFGEHPEVKRWWDWMKADRYPDQHDEIPLLYFLNRLYVSLTRPQSYLFIIDTPAAVEGFWKQWENVIQIVKRDNIRNELNSHIAFREFSKLHDWSEWGNTLFEKAEKTQDIRDYERARVAYQKANEAQKVKKVDARIAELLENWERAGDLYREIQEFARAADCYEKSENWTKAIEALKPLLGQPQINRRFAICQFRYGCTKEKSQKRMAALHFLTNVESDSGIEKKYIQELANVLEEVEEYVHAAGLFERLHREHQDMQAGIQAGRCWQKIDKYEKALENFRKCRYYGTEYIESLRKQAHVLKSRGDYQRAAASYSELGSRGQRDAYVQQGLCLYRLKKYREALDAFDKGDYRDKEYDLCRAEIALKENQVLDAVRLIAEHGEYERILSVAADRKDPEIVSYVAEAHYKLHNFPKAIEFFNTLAQHARDTRDFSALNDYLTRIGYCQYELGLKEAAYTCYKEGRAYEKAIQVAQELGKPEEEIKRLRAEAARNKRPPDFDTAIDIYEELGDAREAASVRGHRLKYLQKHLEAIDYFVQAREWDQVLDCIENGSFATKQERIQAKIKVLKTASHVGKLHREKRDRVMEWVREIREDEDWSKQISHREMGIVYEKFASFIDAADFYERYYRDEQWAREGWLRVKEAQCRYHEERNEHDKAEKIRQRIQEMQTALHSDR